MRTNGNGKREAEMLKTEGVKQDPVCTGHCREKEITSFSNVYLYQAHHLQLEKTHCSQVIAFRSVQVTYFVDNIPCYSCL